ncbi:MAG: DUF928 domain-containing protein [Myxococcota bacterium]
MSCERTGEIDLAEFLLERAEPRFAEFRAHYPGCVDCALEVGRMTRLEQALGHPAPTPAGPHPAEETLLAYAQTPTVLAFQARRGVESHLEACAPCRSEVTVLERFDFAAIGLEVAEPTEVNSLWTQLQDGMSGMLESMRGGLAQPALVGAGVAAVLVAGGTTTYVATTFDRGGQNESAPPMFAAQPSSEAVLPGELPADLEAADETFLAAEAEAPPIAEPTLSPDAAQLAEATAPSSPRSVSPEPAAERSDAEGLVAGPDVTLLAAHWPDSPIQYGVDQIELLGGTSVRSHGNARSLGSEPTLELKVLAPDHVGWTRGASPTLYYWLSQPSELPIEITLSDDVSIEPLAEHMRAGPHAAGLQAVSLAELGVQLEPGVVYRWQIAAVPDAARRSRDVRAGAAVLWQVPDAATAAALERAEVGQRAHRLAEQGYWYDAFEQLSDWIGAGAEVAGLHEARDALLEQVDLEISVERSVQ